MNKLLLKTFILGIAGILFGLGATAQETESAYNENSVYPIMDYHQHFKHTIWRRMDLREKQNLPFFSKSNEITRIMIDAVKDGLIYPYIDDSLNKRMSKEQFFENMQLPDQQDNFGGADSGWGSSADSGWGDTGGETEAVEAASNYYFANQLYLLKIQEDMIFDKVRARLYFDIQSIEMVLPADETATGLEKSIAVFKYKDLEALFRSLPEKAIWYNRQNTAKHLNMSDAFLLRLFHARVYKVSNPKDDQIQDIYLDPKAALIRSQQLEEELIETEHNLWEF
ncbi:MAG: gliding motility protein GldN [Cyclobacteriaceae bacterium]